MSPIKYMLCILMYHTIISYFSLSFSEMRTGSNPPVSIYHHIYINRVLCYLGILWYVRYFCLLMFLFTQSFSQWNKQHSNLALLDGTGKEYETIFIIIRKKIFVKPKLKLLIFYSVFPVKMIKCIKHFQCQRCCAFHYIMTHGSSF
jgi:hypothetical protein